ncbi:MAG TPA: hypothetical protein VGM58_04335 [Verrucomicrobiae bacterium]
MAEDITFEKWQSLSEEEQRKIEATWNPYANGYWQNLLTQATEKFKQEFSKASQIVDVTCGTYHGGTLIIGVTLNLPLGERLKEIPSRFAGFHVQQFWSSKRAL